MSDQLSTHLSSVWSHLTPIRPVRGEGVYLFDAEGRRYTDFTSGIGVTSTGHCHPRVVDAIRRQAAELLFSQVNIAVPPVAEELALALSKLTPGSIDRFFFANSGAEAIEGALKLARHATGRTNLVVFQGSFHGRTHQAMAMTTSRTAYRHRYQPLPGGVFVAPFPDARRHGGSEADAVHYCLEQLELMLISQSAPDETAAMFIEPVLGEGGYHPAPAAFLRGLRELCDRHGILLVFDEVQTGFGRTGKTFAFEHSGVAPDILVMAKGLASGLPVSAVGASAELMSRWEPGTHGGTYGGGSAVPLAAALATIETLLDEELIANAARQGERLRSGLNDLKRRVAGHADVRGLGLMVAVEFRDEDGEPDKAATKGVQRACLDQGLLLLTCGSYENVIRWIPPLVVTGEQIDEALAVFAEALNRNYRSAVAGGG
ncbi:MAG: aminotransferase class III-fold pyridoxal phosphate-dependent enzyme [Trueperaceae bacterium]